MNKKLRKKLIDITKKRVKNDLSHDFNHLYRVLRLAERIAKSENADLDVITPAALFHDIIVYKGTSKENYEVEESALFAAKILKNIKEYPQKKIKQVVYAISVCSYSKNIKPGTLEAKVLQDADLLEATGAVSIMRTFGSSMVMQNRSFYNPIDPFCEERRPEDRIYSLDLFFTRLLVVDRRINTKMARQMTKRRIKFLYKFLRELNLELKESDDRREY
jgi:uncharacterized protein